MFVWFQKMPLQVGIGFFKNVGEPHKSKNNVIAAERETKETYVIRFVRS